MPFTYPLWFPLGGDIPNPPDYGVPANHVTDGLNRLCQQFKDKPNIVALLTIFLQRYQDLETAFWQLLTQRGIYVAEGVQLDAIGKIVGQPRNGLGDDDYRRYIFARILTDKSDGIIEDLIAIALMVLNDSNAQILIMNTGMAALILRVKNITISDALANIALDFLQEATTAGVRLILESQTVGDSDSWFFAVSTFAAGALSIGNTTINVDSTAGFPASGTLDLDTGLAVVESVAYTGVTATSFIGVTPLVHNHVDRSEVALSGSPGRGMGDTSTPATGGQMSSARDSHYG